MKSMPVDFYDFSEFELDFLQLFDFEKTLRMERELGPDDARVQYLRESRKKFDEKPLHTLCNAPRSYQCSQVAKYIVIPVRYCHLDMATVKFSCRSGNHTSSVQRRYRAPSIVRPFSLQGLKELLEKFTQRNLAEDFIYHLCRAWGLIGETATIFPGSVETFLWGERFHTLTKEDFEELLEEAARRDEAKGAGSEPEEETSAQDPDESDDGDTLTIDETGDQKDQMTDPESGGLTVTASGYLDTLSKSNGDDPHLDRQWIREKIDYTNWKCRSVK
jgi:hypothetical protein